MGMPPEWTEIPSIFASAFALPFTNSLLMKNYQISQLGHLLQMRVQLKRESWMVASHRSASRPGFCTPSCTRHLVDYGIVLCDQDYVAVFLQDGHELDEYVGAADLQLCEVAVQRRAADANQRILWRNRS